jgi:hypothetical protein
MHKVTNFFWYCSGADIELLKQCRTESSKYVGIGATVFFTGVFAALAAAYALYTVFDSYFAAITFGLLWGLMIFNLDRFIVSSMRKEGKTRRELVMALPRIILAILISIVIAKPLELKVFQKEIEPELVVMEQQKFAQQEAQVRARYQMTQDSIKSEIAQLKGEIITQANKRDELVRIAQEEADGTGGSKKKNLGPIYKAKKADADKAQKELDQIAILNQGRITSLESSYGKNDDFISKDISSIERGRIDGFAARIEALNRINNESSAIWIAHIFIILLFIAIETSPVFVKLISGRGPYDNLLRSEEHRFVASEIQTLAAINADTKERSSTLPQHEKSFITDKLDASLK